jgi:hypothetical protein
MSTVVGAKLKFSEILVIGFKGGGGVRGTRGQSLSMYHTNWRIRNFSAVAFLPRPPRGLLPRTWHVAHGTSHMDLDLGLRLAHTK